MKRVSRRLATCATAFAVVASGCADMNQTQRGVAAGRIAVEGRAAREPVASNDTPDGRARNRRVEIFVSEPARQG